MHPHSSAHPLVARRRFLAGALALAAGGACPRPAAAIDPIPRSGGSHLRLSIAAYSYRKYLDLKKPTMTLEDFVNLAADLGLDAVEPTAYYFADTSPAYLARLRNRCIRLGLDVSGGAIGNNFCLSDRARWQTEVDRTKEWIARYALLGAKAIRIFAGSVAKGDSEEECRKRCLEAIHLSCDEAAKHGIFLALENHGGITATPDQLLALVHGVRHDWFGVNFDSGNFHTADPYADLARIAPYAVNAQIKTEIQRAGQKKEEADLARIVGILRKAGYRGYVALEYEGADEPKTAIPRHLEVLRKLMG